MNNVEVDDGNTEFAYFSFDWIADMSTIPDFDTAVHEAENWIDDLVQRLGWHDRQRAYLALLAALHALRDALPRDQAIYLGAELPVLLRGLYYEGWHHGPLPMTRSRSAFLSRIHDGVHRDPAIDAEHLARCVFALLAARLPAAEVEEVKAAIAPDLHNLWPS